VELQTCTFVRKTQVQTRPAGHEDDEMTNDDRDLLAARGGDQDAFARLYERHAGVVMSLCRRWAAWSDAEDAMQETFLRAYRRLHQLHHPSGFRAWLYAIARRVCSERRRSTSRRDRHETAAAEVHVVLSEPPPGPDAVAEQVDQLDRLTIALNTLSEPERLAIHLYYLDDEPVRAASSALGLSRSGYYKLLTRARNRLAASMRERQLT
jgi:RNA polymerase sigma-70 factor (ECF subfamily)